MIGVFDSGFGGLTILKGLLDLLPAYDYMYLGDNARAPYGDKSERVIFEYTRQAVEFLLDKNCELVILACNTASSIALSRIQKEYLPKKFPDRKVLGVVIPVSEVAAQADCGRIGVIATRATIESGAYVTEIKKIKRNAKIFQQSCPLLVPLVEEGWAREDVTKIILSKYLGNLKKRKIDSLVLGCTHYPLLKNEIKKIMGKKTNILDSSIIVAGKFKQYLVRHREVEKRLGKNSRRDFYTTDNTKKFQNIGEYFLKRKIKKASKISLD